MPRLELEEGLGLPDWSLSLRRLGGKWAVAESSLLKQYAPERQPRQPDHIHEYGQNDVPVLGFDLHQTLTPDWGFPLVSPPFPGVKPFLDRMAGRGACVHVCSASLDNPDPDISKARTALVKAWLHQYGLPVSFVGPNSEASVRVDDRGITIPLDPDWASALPDQFEARLAEQYELGPQGLYRERTDLQPLGSLLSDDDYPDPAEVADDRPRGLTTPLIDFDLHRTLMPGWGTRRDAAPDSGMVDLLRRLYQEGYSIQVSCGGWNPSTNNPDFSGQRSAWQRRYLAQWGIPYDRLVAKDDVTVWGDDKVLAWESAKQIEPLLRAKLGPPVSWGANNPINEPDAPIKSWYFAAAGISKAELTSVLAQHRVDVLAEVHSAVEKAPQPVNVTVNLPEGLAQTTISEGAVKVDVQPPHLNVGAGAIAVTNQPPGGDVTITHPDGKTTRLERR